MTETLTVYPPLVRRHQAQRTLAALRRAAATYNVALPLPIIDAAVRRDNLTRLRDSIGWAHGKADYRDLVDGLAVAPDVDKALRSAEKEIARRQAVETL